MNRRSWIRLITTCVVGASWFLPAGAALAEPPAAPAGVGIAQAPPPSVVSFSLDDVIQMSLAKNPQVTAAQEAVTAATQRLVQARAGFLPTVSVGATASYGTTTVTGPPLSEPRTSDTFSVTGSLPVYDNGRTRIAIDQTQAALAAAQATLRQTRQDVALSAATAFVSVLKTVRVATVREAQLAQAQAVLTQAQAQVRAGVAAPADVIQAQAQVAQAQVDLLAARSQIEVTKGALRSVLAMDVLAPFETQEPAIRPVALTFTMDAALREARENRPEIAKAAADVQASTAALALAYATNGFQVTVGLNTTYVIGSTAPGVTDTTAWSIGATVTLPLFEGGRNQAAIAEAQANLRAAQARADAVGLSIRQDAFQAYLAAAQAIANLSATQAAQNAAAEALRVAEGRYRAGVGTILEVTTARTQAAQTEVNAINAQYDYQGALSTLRHGLGRPVVGGSL